MGGKTGQISPVTGINHGNGNSRVLFLRHLRAELAGKQCQPLANHLAQFFIT